MWYSRIIEAATAWEVLSTKEISWKGNFENSFDGFSFYKGSTNIPTVVALRKFIEDITRRSSSSGSLFDKYFEKPTTQIEYDTSLAISNLISWCDDYISKGKLDTDLVFILNFIGQMNEKYQQISNSKQPFTIGYSTSDPLGSHTLKNSLSMGFTTLKLLYEKGIRLIPEFEIAIAQDRDINLAGTSDTEDRKIVKNKILKLKPELKFFRKPQDVIDVIKNYTSDKDQIVLDGYSPDKETINKFVNEFLQSVPGDYAFLVIEAFFDNDNFNFIENLYRTKFSILIELYKKIKTEKLSYEFTEVQRRKLNQLLENIFNGISQESLRSYKNLFLNDPDFMNLVRDKEAEGELGAKFIYTGYASPETIEKFAKENPDKIDDLITSGALEKMSEDVKNSIITQARKENKKIQTDSLAFLEEAKKRGYINIYSAEDEFNNPAYGMKLTPDLYDDEGNLIQSGEEENYFLSYLERMLQEAPFSGSNIEDLKNYASYMKVFEFDLQELSSFAYDNKIKKLIIGGINLLDGNWSGLFVPRLNLPDGNIPAIFIRTDAYNTLEYHQQLAKSIGMKPSQFTESTRRHEIAHALQYLSNGDAIMEHSFLLNPEVTKEESYLINPSEMYARVHGNIPYLLKIFDSHISELKTDKKVYEAAKSQWVSEMEDALVHLSSGGVNTRRLMEDIEKERGHFGWIIDKKGKAFKIPDPHEAVSKTLERQRKRLEDMFYELYQVQGRRDFRLSLLKRRNKLRNEVETISYDNPKKSIIENELKKLDELIIASGQYLIFDVAGVSESVIEGYLTDYFGKLANAISEGLIDRDVINPEGIDQLIEKTESESEYIEPPTSKDIRDIARSQIGFSEPIPSGRKLDVVIPKYIGEGRPSGYFPQDKKEKSGPGSEITIESEDKDKFTEEKTASFNYRRWLK